MFKVCEEVFDLEIKPESNESAWHEDVELWSLWEKGGEQLAYLSRKLNFNKFMIISKHIEDNCNGRENEHILEDVFEAFLGALFLDSNDNKLIEKFIINCIETHIDIVDLILNDNNTGL